MANDQIVVNRENFARYNEACLQATIRVLELSDSQPELAMDDPVNLARRQDVVWSKTVELFNDPNFEPER